VRLAAPGQDASTAFCLLWFLVPSADARLTLIASLRESTITAAARSELQTRLGLSQPLVSTTVPDLLAELLLNPPEGKWPPLRPTLGGEYEVWLNRERWLTVRAIRGGAQASSSFDGSENPLSEGGVWTVGQGNYDDVQKVAGRARAAGILPFRLNSALRNTPTIGADQFATCTVFFSGGGPDLDYAGPVVRLTVGVDLSCYHGTWAFDSGPNALYIEERDSAGTPTTLSTGGTPATGDVARLEAEGSTLRLFQNGILRLTATDTTLGSGQPGIFLYATADSATIELDDWAGGDLVTLMGQIVC
jgi:hypothetical protein